MIEKQSKIKKEEKAILVAVGSDKQPLQEIEEYLDELTFLAETAGAITVERIIQKLPHPDSKTYIGKGKLAEIKNYIQANPVDVVIFDDELSGSQISNIEKELRVKILDRSDLILDIFANRARTAQAKVQVELAQYQYLLPRLKGMWQHLERQGGGIGSRGPGETEIETDRRIVNNKISILKKKLTIIERQVATQRQERSEFVRVSLVGYTNVGKSTLMNVLSKSDILAENKLFATLDTTTRKVVWNNTPFLLSDTVGFIRKLPHHLIESFKTTLDEVRDADILLHVVDIAHPKFVEQMSVVNKTLEDIKAVNKKIITVFNKWDLYESQYIDQWLLPNIQNDVKKEFQLRWQQSNSIATVFVSAFNKTDMQALKVVFLNAVQEIYKIRYPYRTTMY
ncbi:MAG: GTPase HflX [Phycisphaerales bacterium]|nr:GTPase HflX [Phycisphaerales bacterium]